MSVIIDRKADKTNRGLRGKTPQAFTHSEYEHNNPKNEYGHFLSIREGG